MAEASIVSATAAAPQLSQPSSDPTAVLASGLFQLLLPVVEQLESSVDGVQTAQTALKTNIESLMTELRQFNEVNAATQPVNLDVYIKKLITARRRVTTVSNTLGETQARIQRLQQSIAKEQKRKKETLDAVTIQAAAAAATGQTKGFTAPATQQQPESSSVPPSPMQGMASP
ncbi:hypothetical protein CAOG_06066 [Capsaspora owczarzaki ATCC 30864]|uniref:Biogenesis of lysosome-related organelles complex 1 subunit 7 n=1 Tax=Capsaspora owczarzaki (strain ATCC 30864) TaxID=595528 RepID=A0A0D2WTB4_CAPO3|nr:hypothetical protein CAOG_06066 [Capsaspora owczarzaki ATCC 30864]KJE95635.1 hypothetical protein CAOG_006066 [Capsaspora owczarzaki ATCC 30864]|eukprot:XP_004345656.1 hypothetical protein CAOG_06066 [Capsaspora owczarzaki ATCC 30864]